MHGSTNVGQGLEVIVWVGSSGLCCCMLVSGYLLCMYVRGDGEREQGNLEERDGRQHYLHVKMTLRAWAN